MDIMYKRRSIRQYTNKRVEEEKIEQILRMAMQAPTAQNQRPWEFLVIRGKQNLDFLAQFATNFSPLTKANVGILVMADRRRMTLPRAWEQDLGCACQNMLLEATNQGLGACWCGIAATVPEEKWVQIRRGYALPSDYLLYAAISIGYPITSDENYHFDHFDPARIHYLGS